MEKINSEYIKILNRLSNILREDKYLILGSAATLSYTSKVGYTRQMNDLDIIANHPEAMKIKQKLLKDGFVQSTFINKRMPFYSKLIKKGASFYLRFSKKEINIEVLSTKFQNDNGFLKFDLYPNFWAKVPQYAIVKTKLGNAKFTSLDPDLVWAIKQFLNITLGKLMNYKGEQRREDLSALKGLVNIKKARNILSKCKIGYKLIGVSIPTFFLR